MLDPAQPPAPQGRSADETARLPWSGEELAAFVGHGGRGRILVVRPGPRSKDRFQEELQAAGYRVGRLPLTREVTHLPLAAAAFLPDLVYVLLAHPVEPALVALELLAADPRTGHLPLVAVVAPGVDRSVVAAAYGRSGCDFLSAEADSVALLARTHLLVRLSRALAEAGCAPVVGPPQVEAANDPSGETRFLTDPETGVYSRCYLLHRLPSEISRARRYQRPLSVLSVFVPVLGEDEAGAVSAPDVAATLKRRVRTADLVGRPEPAVFAVLLPETTVDDAGVLAVRVRADFADRGVAVYVGTAGLDEAGVATYSADRLLAAAIRRSVDAHRRAGS